MDFIHGDIRHRSCKKYPYTPRFVMVLVLLVSGRVYQYYSELLSWSLKIVNNLCLKLEDASE